MAHQRLTRDCDHLAPAPFEPRLCQRLAHGLLIYQQYEDITNEAKVIEGRRNGWISTLSSSSDHLYNTLCASTMGEKTVNVHQAKFLSGLSAMALFNLELVLFFRDQNILGTNMACLICRKRYDETAKSRTNEMNPDPSFSSGDQEQISMSSGDDQAKLICEQIAALPESKRIQIYARRLVSSAIPSRIRDVRPREQSKADEFFKDTERFSRLHRSHARDPRNLSGLSPSSRIVQTLPL